MTLCDTLAQVMANFHPRILFAYLFGSAGTSLQRPQSDVDIAVFFDPKAGEATFDHKLHLYAAISRVIKQNHIDIVVLNTCSNHILMLGILHTGRVVYDSCPEYRALFEQKALHAAIDFKEQRDRVMA
jgi:predicted nucleotidyltransferase